MHFVADSGLLICLVLLFLDFINYFGDQITGYDAFLISSYVLCEGNTKGHSVKEEIPGC